MFKEKLAESISKILGIKKEEAENLLEVPPERSLGDYSLPCFKLASQLRKNPNIIASEIAEKLEKNPIKEIREIKVLNGYINFFLNTNLLAESAISRIIRQKENYGSGNIGKGKKVMVEFSSPNTNKPLHLGHLRNETIGNSISNILKFSGYDVIKGTFF